MYQSTIGTTFKMGDAPSTLTEVPGMIDFPDMLGSPDKIQVTTQKDKQHKYIEGLLDPGDMAFTFGYEGMDAGTNWATLKTAGNTEKTYQLVFPDGSGFQWTGTVSLSMPGKGIGEALVFTANISPTGDIEEISASE